MNTPENTRNNQRYTGFGDLSPSGKSQKAKMMYDYLVKLSGNSPGELMDYFLNKSKFGKDLIESVRNEFRMLRMTLNIQALHQSLDKYSDQKSNVLALVADTHSRKEIRDMGFKLSNTQYAEAKRKAEDGLFSLGSKRHKADHSSRIISKDTKEIVVSYLLNNSRASSNTCKVKQENGKYMYQPVYYLDSTKLDIYNSICREKPGIKLGLSTFYTLCLPNFKKGKKRVDMCPICIKGENNEKRLRKINPEDNTELSGQIRRQVGLYKKHLLVKKRQSEAYKACLDRSSPRLRSYYEF
ncbi:hypothetical protein BB559_002997 [Furculomyces boomerangus]|uniref:Uncharacterized protein n=1 Tax=Furculomyces boomerangus TaxID=61424 RepID=A0A2T9YQG2_9FUNG|nr:hypothetical protein BB559_002997 [Furculomyces boomerangus]